MPDRATQTTLPLSEAQLGLLHGITDKLDQTGLTWLSGYAAGIARGQLHPPTPTLRGVDVLPADTPSTPLTIVYGSQTGNARRVAETLAAEIETTSLPVRLLRADAYPLRELKNERHLYVVISTQGDGDPPDDARDFYEHLLSKRAPRLDQLKFAVLGLGDSSYPQFCIVGQAIDARLAELGATRLLPRADADLDIETVSHPWREQALTRAKETLKPSATITPLRPAIAAAVASGFSREHPFQAEVLTNQRITAHGSHKDVRHIELSLEGSSLHYEPGDALGVWPRNPEPLVDAVLSTLVLDGESAVTHDSDTLSLRQWLLDRRELTRVSRPFIASHASHAKSDELSGVLAPENATQLQQLIAQAQVLDLLQRYPGAWSADELVAALRPLTPRLYSIASSQKHVGDEVHLTVAHVEYMQGAQPRWGAASHLLSSHDEGARLPVYIEANDRFRLPADTSRDIIMIGPGTGIAPFRAFMQERKAVGAAGRSWLLFGNPHFRSDFLYQLEWQRALKDGSLSRIDLAFSRDGVQKIYVQQRIAERARELYDWLQNGAHLYVCGAIAMGKDVHAALLDAVATHNGGDRDAATETLDQLAREGRYARDVY